MHLWIYDQKWSKPIIINSNLKFFVKSFFPAYSAISGAQIASVRVTVFPRLDFAILLFCH